jgi:molybdopterin/thiamine biosynthesis adenylyltransferase
MVESKTLSNMAHRHRGDLGGRLTDTRIPARVVVALGQEAAQTATGQHLLWMLVNLLARQSVEIHQLELRLPRAVRAVPYLSPLVPQNVELYEALNQGLDAIHPGLTEPKEQSAAEVFIRVGSGPLEPSDLTLATTAVGWSGYVGRQALYEIGNDGNPIGAYVAACLCAGEVFKFVRAAKADAAEAALDLWLDSFNLRIVDQPDPGPGLPQELPLKDAVLAGVGAVGNAFLHTLYPLNGVNTNLLMLDGDPHGVESSNLNRYVLFGRNHVGSPKASSAAAMFDQSTLHIEGSDEFWGQWRENHPSYPLRLVLSAVDKNIARHEIQDALPELILGASTNEMRAQLNLYDVDKEGQCLRCRNPAETETPDEAVIARLKSITLAEREAEALHHRVPPDKLEMFLTDPVKHCGLITGAALRLFAGDTDEAGEWSVGFVSTLAGTLLAAEYIKQSLWPAAALDARTNLFRFQFWRPENRRVNARATTLPDATCLCQSSLFKRVLSNRRQSILEKP